MVLEMFDYITKYKRIFIAQFVFFLSVSVNAASIDVLDTDEITSANIPTLVEDTKVFRTIGMSIALSIAECDGKDICNPNVNENEIEQLIKTLDQRIEGVVSRQQESEEELTSIITAYVDTKEKYSDYMDRLSRITKNSEPELSFEQAFGEEDAMTEDEFSAFDDFEESLEDDEDSEEFEDEYDPEDI